ncbi:uncharacterized protein DS421_14g462300 [Arachis hypogaea]|nr:uncharacterized protein DS421_14g462300 [Arachis hypogaea]
MPLRPPSSSPVQPSSSSASPFLAATVSSSTSPCTLPLSVYIIKKGASDSGIFWMKLRELSKNLIQTEKKLLMLLDSDLPALEMDFLELQNFKWHTLNCVGK